MGDEYETDLRTIGLDHSPRVDNFDINPRSMSFLDEPEIARNDHVQITYEESKAQGQYPQELAKSEAIISTSPKISWTWTIVKMIGRMVVVSGILYGIYLCSNYLPQLASASAKYIILPVLSLAQMSSHMNTY